MGGKYDTGDAGKEGNMMYDDAAFQLFLVAILATIWIPWFLYRLIRFIRRSLHTKTPLEEAKEAWCTCSLCQEKADRLTTKRGIHKIGIGNIIFAIITVALVILSIRVYRANLTAEPPFDPFSILGVSESATTREIKKAYRRLSVIHHPDKNRNDPSAGERFIKITKAFAALTDEAAKENYIKYGNPDGYMGTTLGLGLPEWVAESGSIVLVAYFLFMVIAFPLVVGMWWHKRSQQFTSEVLTQTLMLYGETLKQTSRFRDLLAAFCGSVEFSNLYSSDNDEHVQSIMESLKRLGNTDIRKTKSFFETSQVQIQNLFILTAYLARIPIPEQLQYVLNEMLTRSEPLLTVMTDTSGAFQRPECRASWNKQLMRGHTNYLGTCISMQQCIIQALDEKVSPFLQIPHFTDKEVKYCVTSRSPVVRTIYDFMKLETADQRKLLRGFSDDQFLDVQAFCNRYPSANLEVSEAYVEEEEDSTVHAGDTVTVKAKLTVMRRSGSAFSPHTPNLPYRKEEVWWIWLADQKHRVPIEVKRLLAKTARGHDAHPRRRSRDSCCGIQEEEEHDEHMERLTRDPRVTVFDVKFRFLAPKAGIYNLGVVAACDCYKGASKTYNMRMKVEKEVEPPPEDSVRYFDTDDESSSEGESSSSEEEETDGEYEYVTDDGEDGLSDDEEDGGDIDDDADDGYGLSESSGGDGGS